MTVLIDTHTFIWFGESHVKLSELARDVISDSGNTVLVSPASYWELAIKVSIGKFETIGMGYEQYWRQSLRRNQFKNLPVRLRHCALLSSLPFHHKDPFDRMLVAQALVDDLTLVSNDRRLDAYGVRRLW